MTADRATKPLCLISAALIGVALLGTNSQAGNFTAVGGLTRTDVSGTSDGHFSSNGVGWFFGGMINIAHYINGGLETGLLFGQRRLTQSTAGGSAAPQTLNIDATYLEIPVEYDWHISRLIFFGAGVYALHYVGGSYKTFVSANPGTAVANSFTLSPDEFGGLLTLGGEFPTSKQTALRIEARYSAGAVPTTNASQEAAVIMGFSYHF